METVIEKWSRDIREMESEIAERIKALDVYTNQFRMRVNKMKDAVNALKNSFKTFANAMRVDANAISARIWGTQEAKGAWQKKYGR
ncbi:MAG: hypothetical protein H3Z51_09935 [archaeon]|nr:hypothetical protein [archaeon]